MYAYVCYKQKCKVVSLNLAHPVYVCVNLLSCLRSLICILYISFSTLILLVGSSDL